ncbi:MAG: 2Fe-2S iron-sulfur cluster binding domain-containing protein [Rhodospirillales bacterium]|nr:2Fe-2S iron-sulfur cluster binding domain-containing protein [Rhodospirillales bacterium]
MPRIVFISREGERRTVEGTVGSPVMLAARGNNVAGIEAECAGALSCGTCHVYVAPEFASRFPAPSEQEEEMLQFVAAERREGSRLSCQIVVTDDIDGLTLEIPETQG